MEKIEYIKDNDTLLAIIVYADNKSEGVNFITPDDFPLQLGILNFPDQHKIQPHIHNIRKPSEQIAQEVLFVKKGRVKVNFYNDQKEYLLSKIIVKDDIILLASGGHGFEMLEDSQMIEVKQGPFVEGHKTPFEPVENV